MPDAGACCIALLLLLTPVRARRRAKAKALTECDADEEGWYGNVRVKGPVERRDWDLTNPRFAEEAVKLGRPYIFTGTPASKWHALQNGTSRRWSNEYLKSRLKGRQLWTQESTSSNFLYWSVTELRPTFDEYEEPTAHFWMDADKFVDAVAPLSMGGSGRALYYNKMIDSRSPFNPVRPPPRPSLWCGVGSCLWCYKAAASAAHRCCTTFTPSISSRWAAR
eukprot:SAG11_NODE_249_length_11637_cov_3.320073_11_plen_222_part_00